VFIVTVAFGYAFCLQQPAYFRPRFPAIRDGSPGFPKQDGFPGFPQGARSSSNLIVIQTEPMEGNEELAQQPSAAEHLRLPGPPQSQLPASSSTAPSALLRPQDKWQAKDAPKPKRMSQSAVYNLLYMSQITSCTVICSPV